MAAIARSPALSDSDLQSTRDLLDSLYSFGKSSEDDKKLAKLLKHTDHSVTAPEASTSQDNGTAEQASSSKAITITSWKMQDYAYKRDPCPYPTRARGLFTEGKERIVARAYDKFFNVDEVSWTKWDKLPELTAAPYHLTLKSNGCLILISALTPDTLLVTSKHAVGQSKETAVKNKQTAQEPHAEPGRITSHALVGEMWLDEGLSKVTKTRKDLAKRLWDENWTLVAELCDDNFEEHILPYAADRSGLHLHGIVVNHPTLLTLPPDDVNAVARQYGFIETPYMTLNSVAEVRKFTDDIANSDGKWQGQHVEGFVVRAALKAGSLTKQPLPNDLTEGNWQDVKRVFMWKIKFDQPYLMWREWRELTKKLLSVKKKEGDDVAKRGREKLASVAGPNSSPGHGLADTTDKFARATIDEGEEDGEVTASTGNKAGKGAPSWNDEDDAPTINLARVRNPLSRLYVTWLETHMKDHPEDFVNYQDNRGIIAVREKFLVWKDNTDEGQRMEEEIVGKKAPVITKAGGDLQKVYDRTILVPIAVPGCGKTMLGLALSHLFGFAHTQSDDITEKKAAKHFEAKVAKLLGDNAVVFADKNNHLKQHREAMATIAKKSKHSTRLIALIWPLTTLPHNEIHRICSDRIVARGENHQNLRPLKTGEHEVIIMRFFSQHEEFDNVFNKGSDAEFTDIIELNVGWDIEKVLEYTVENLLAINEAAIQAGGEGNGIKGLVRPTKEQLQEAISVAKGYKPKIYKEMKLTGLDSSAANGGNSKGARYYGIAVEVDLPTLLDPYFHDLADSQGINFFHTLRDKNRIEKKPHVTLVHEKELEAAPEPTSESTAELEFCTSLWKKCEDISKRWGDEAVQVTLTLGPLLTYDGRSMSIQVSKLSYSGINLSTEDIPSDKRKDSYHITVGTLDNAIRPVEGKRLLEYAMRGEEVSEPGQKIERLDIKTVEVKGRVRGMF